MNKSKNNIFYVNGDLLQQKVDIICHQTNCIGVMGGGIALSIKKKYPNVYQEYHNFCMKYKENHSKLLGICQIVKTGGKKPFFIANLFGEDVPSANSIDTNYSALKNAMLSLKERILSISKDTPITIGFPYKIGCGLAGGDWTIVEKIIYDVFDGIKNITVVIVKLS